MGHESGILSWMGEDCLVLRCSKEILSPNKLEGWETRHRILTCNNFLKTLDWKARRSNSPADAVSHSSLSSRSEVCFSIISSAVFPSFCADVYVANLLNSGCSL